MHFSIWLIFALSVTIALIIVVRKTHSTMNRIHLLIRTAYLVPIPWIMLALPQWPWIFGIYLPVAILGLILTVLYPVLIHRFHKR